MGYEIQTLEPNVYELVTPERVFKFDVRAETPVVTFTPYLEAEYEDGFILREDDRDFSPYDGEGKNTFNAIYEHKPVAAHGALVRYSLVTPVHTYTIDWKTVPAGARPIRWKHMSHSWLNGVSQGSNIDQIDFGYQWLDSDKQKHENVVKLAGGTDLIEEKSDG